MPFPSFLSASKRFLKRAAGEIIYWPLLHIVPRLKQWQGRKAAPAERTRQFLIVQLADIGDLVLSSPFLRALRTQEPGARIVLVTAPHTAPLALGCPHVDEVATFDYKRTAGRRWKAKREGCLAWWREASLLQRRLFPSAPPDVAFSLRTHGDSIQVASQIILACSHASRRIGYSLKPLAGRLSSRHLLTTALPPESIAHEVERQLHLLQASGISPEPPASLESWVDKDSRAQATHAWERLTIPGGPRIGLGIGAGNPSKRWPSAHFHTLADLLETRLGATIFFIGGPDDTAEADRLTDSPRRINLAGHLPLPVTAALLERLDGFIGNDSGPAHLAAAAGLPVLTLFGPEDPARWAPWTSRGRFLKAANLASLDPETVFLHAQELFLESVSFPIVKSRSKLQNSP